MVAKSSFRLRLRVIYLVGQGESARSEVRVTQRTSDLVKPATCQFTVVDQDEKANPLGTLVLTEDLWKQWYGQFKKEDFMPGMDTAAGAAEVMVRSAPGIFYGCPLCNFRTKDARDMQAHADAESTRLLRYFDVTGGE